MCCRYMPTYRYIYIDSRQPGSGLPPKIRVISFLKITARERGGRRARPSTYLAPRLVTGSLEQNASRRFVRTYLSALRVSRSEKEPDTIGSGPKSSSAISRDYDTVGSTRERPDFEFVARVY